MMDADKRAALAIDPLCSRPRVVIAPRKPLSRRDFAQLLLDQDGRCGCGCGHKLDAHREGIVDEHLKPLAQGGGNELTNRSLWRKPCSAEKTRADNPRTAHAKRQECLTRPKEPSKRPIRGGQKLHGRPFDKTKTRSFGGQVRPRKQKEAGE